MTLFKVDGHIRANVHVQMSPQIFVENYTQLLTFRKKNSLHTSESVI